MTKLSIVRVLGNYIKNIREEKGILSKELAAATGIDAAMVSRFEANKRLPSRLQINRLAKALQVEEKSLLRVWLADMVVSEVGYGEIAIESLMLAEEQIRMYGKQAKPVYPEDINSLLSQIDEFKARLQQKAGAVNYRILEANDVEYTFESNRIEGNTLSLQETAMVIAEGITISGKSVREHLEAINHFEAVGFLRELVQTEHHLKEKHILQLHHLVLRGIDKQNAGKYRTVPVRITGSSHIPPEPFLVAPAMEAMFDWYNESQNRLHPVILAAEMHERLVTIHPFIDGNGRTARLVMNFILLQHGYAIANISGDAEKRLAYYRSLDAARQDDKTGFYRFILNTELQNLQQLSQLLGN